ncbi:MAG: AMP-binding protein, partial [Planctomycetota bacterium]|nr:AMP-binding protein [Planctomycetota bacterium]
MATHSEIHERSLSHREQFWAHAAEQIDWIKPWQRVLDSDRPPFYRWFDGGELNTCFNALDRHADGNRAQQLALIHDSSVSGVVTRLTYAQLRDRVAVFAGALARFGVVKGDRVLIYMPMVPEAVVAILACARLGAVHSVVFGGFAPHELAVRIDDAQPRVIVSASCGVEGKRVIPYKPLIDAAIEQADHTPERCVVLQRPMIQAELQSGRDLSWDDALDGAKPHDCVPVAATDPLYILYTSGTTGKPKGVVRDNGGHAVALHWSMKNIYGVNPGEVFWAASDIGWVVGHSYIISGPLLHGNTTVMFEGKPVGTPDAGAFWRVAADHGVAAMFTAPTAFRAIKQFDPDGSLAGKYDLLRLRTLFLAGERCDPETLHWAEKLLGIPVIDHWWQTETGWPVAANCLGIEQLPVKPGSVGRAVPGWDVHVVDADGVDLPAGTMGEIVCRLPLPPGSLPSLWRNDDNFVSTYMTKFTGCYETDDAGFIDEDGYIHIMARTDDIINVAGHRLSTGGMEEVLIGHPDIADAAVIGAADDLKGQLPVGLVVLNAGVTRPHAEIVAEIVQRVREQ